MRAALHRSCLRWQVLQGHSWLLETLTPPGSFAITPSESFAITPPGGVRDDGAQVVRDHAAGLVR